MREMRMMGWSASDGNALTYTITTSSFISSFSSRSTSSTGTITITRDPPLLPRNVVHIELTQEGLVGRPPIA
jgi:hypothetical protein